MRWTDPIKIHDQLKPLKTSGRQLRELFEPFGFESETGKPIAPVNSATGSAMTLPFIDGTGAAIGSRSKP